MKLYPLMLFLHVTADILIFVGLGVQLFCLAGLRRAQTVEQVRALVPLIRLSDPLGITGGLLVILSGLYMALTVWDLRQGWIATALGSLILFLPPLIGAIIEPRTRAIVKHAAGAVPGPLPPELRARLHDPLLATALQTAAAVVLGIVFLMTNKPALAGSVAAMGVFVVLGVVSGLPHWRAVRLAVQPRTGPSEHSDKR
jgi:uncharacterized membrane protein